MRRWKITTRTISGTVTTIDAAIISPNGSLRAITPVNFAIATVIVLADEPDASLDPHSGEDVMRLLSDLARQDGLTLIVISHRLEHTIQFSDRIIGLADGQISLDVATRDADPVRLRRFFNKPKD